MITRAASALALVLSFAAASGETALGSVKAMPPRQVVSLDGDWEIEQGSLDSMPGQFSHKIVVPGLADMAKPAFAEAGKKSKLRQAFWYRRTFSLDGDVPAVAILKINKARYGAKVYLNGRVVGEHLPCFTPAHMDVQPYLQGGGRLNELVVRVGAERGLLPQDMVTGSDFEKRLYLPGIYDSVELILTGAPYIVNVQVVPDVPGKAVRVVAEIQTDGAKGDFSTEVTVNEAKSGKAVVLPVKGPAIHCTPDGRQILNVVFPISDCRFWSPEAPFLYEARIRTGADAVKTRFGMRSFRSDPETRRVMLNEKPYFMRGTNVCIFRFFEDARRGDLPWRADWVRRLHQKYKAMNWNAIRYCIGFPPEIWYDIADEEGFLIQDEFPIWIGAVNKPREPGIDRPKAEKLISEYTEWMRERWNHPCVVIWDASNETATPETVQAIKAVRRLDLSNRPWDNGWSEPQSAADVAECHPYLFIRWVGWDGRKSFHLRELEKLPAVPEVYEWLPLAPQQEQRKAKAVPVIINEYDWLWLNRDGSPTCLTAKVYEGLLGDRSTVEQRRLLHARGVAALTEFWRCHRQAAGVLHFCGLGYSRQNDKPVPEGGATSDDFIDVEKLVLEPQFAEYVREAFSPVGLMLDFWQETVPAGSQRQLKVHLVNDLDRPWRGTVRLYAMRGEDKLPLQTQSGKVSACEREILAFNVTFPQEPGRYTLVAELLDDNGKPVRSLRDVAVK